MSGAFEEGAQVEVSSDEQGFRGSWYSAKIISFPTTQSKKKKKNKNNSSTVFVEFDNLLTDDQKPLRESIDVILIRPIPPRESHRQFHVSEEVDAFHRDGWWEGIVISVLDGRYSVFFRASGEQIDFDESQLRLHREWVNGNWVPPQEGGTKPVHGQTSESQVEGEKSLVPYTPTNGRTNETTSPKSNGKKLVKGMMGHQLGDRSTKGGSKPVHGQTSESQVEGEKSLVYTPVNGSGTETTTSKCNGEKLVKKPMVLQPDDGPTEGESKTVSGQGSETTSPKRNGEKLVKESMVVQPDELSERGLKPVDDQTSESQVKDAPSCKAVELIVLDEDDDIMEELQWNLVDDKQLSNLIEGIQSSSTLPKGHLYDHPHRGRSVTPATTHFSVGTLVEVQTDEKDFVDVFFLATVTRPPYPSKSTSQIYVEYNDLLACEGETDLLKEFVAVSCVRPLPPQEILSGLSPDDVVEAYYNDGWWTGVVKRVLKGGERFRIKFKNPPDEREFGLPDLRIHWDWVNGVWSRPSKQVETVSVTEIGANVEVSRDSDTHYSWFRSTVCRRSSDDGAVLVQFSTLKDHEGDYVKGIVDPKDVRPCSPHFKDKPFVLKQNVDGYFDCGWWSGVVSAVLDSGKYLVTVAYTKTDKLFRQTELRPRMEWENGKWIMSSMSSNATHNTPESFVGSTLKLKIKQKPSKVTLPLSKRRKDQSDSQDAPSRTIKRHKEGNSFRASEQDDRRDSSVTKMSLDSPSPVATPVTAEHEQSSCILSRGRTTRTKKRELVANQSGDKAGFLSSLVKTTTQTSQGKDQSTEVGSSRSGGSSRGVKGHSSNSKEKKLVSDQHIAVQKSKDSTPSQTGASSIKRKRERQPKEVKTPQKASRYGNNDENNAQNEIVAKDTLISHESDQHIIAKKGEASSLTNKESILAAGYNQHNPQTSGSATKTTSPKSSGEKLVNESMDLQPDGSTERGSKPVDGQSFESQVEGAKFLVPCTPANGSPTETISPISIVENQVIESIGWQPDESTEVGKKPVDSQTFESQVEGEKSLVPWTATNGSATETISPISDVEKLVNELMGRQPDGSTDGGSNPVGGKTSESQVEGEKSLVPWTPTNGSATETISPISYGEKLVNKLMGRQPDESTEGGSEPVHGQTFESQVEGEKSLVPYTPTNGRTNETTSPKSNGEKLVKGMMGHQLGDISTKGGSKPVYGQTYESQVEGEKSLVYTRVNGSAIETTSSKCNGEKLVKKSMVLQPDDGPTEGESKTVDGQGSKTNLPIRNGEKLVKESMVVQPDELSERGMKPVDDQTSESQVKDAPSCEAVELIVLDEDDVIMEELQCNLVDNKQLSILIEGMQSSSTVSSAPKVGEIQEVTEKASVPKNTKAGEQTPNSIEKNSVDTHTPDEQQTLPFVKRSFLWETFESMEVFKQNPQKPHFQPLKQQKEGSREGLAIGCMVNFSNAIERVSKLQFGDPDIIANDILDTLADLEEHGFDVGAVRGRVARIAALGKEQRKLVIEANGLRSKIMVHSNEKSRIEKETSEIYEELRRLQEKVSVAQLALDNENGKIAAMQADLLKTEQGIENVEHEFQGIVSAKY